mgnify:CR=1 FL=1
MGLLKKKKAHLAHTHACECKCWTNYCVACAHFVGNDAYSGMQHVFSLLMFLRQLSLPFL